MKQSRETIRRFEAWQAVVEAYQECNGKYSEMLRHFGLTVSQFDVLVAIAALDENATPKRIADRLLVTKGNITGVTQGLEKKGCVTRVNHESDKRSFVFRLTTEGMALLEPAKAAAARFVEHQLKPFSQQEVEHVGNLMRQMKSHLSVMDVQTVLESNA